jgi:hypothetical protein
MISDKIFEIEEIAEQYLKTILSYGFDSVLRERIFTEDDLRRAFVKGYLKSEERNHAVNSEG